MNDHEEELFGRIALRAPSGALDERMEKLLMAEPIGSPGVLGRAVRVWQLGVACAACAACAFLAGTLVHGKEAGPANGEVRYIVQVEPKTFDVFDWTKYPKVSAPVSVLKPQEADKKATYL